MEASDMAASSDMPAYLDVTPLSQPPDELPMLRCRRRRRTLGNEDDTIYPVIKRLFPEFCDSDEEEAEPLQEGSEPVQDASDPPQIISENEAQGVLQAIPKEKDSCHCEDLCPQFTEAGEKSPHVQVNEYLKLDIKPDDLINPKKVQSAMNSAVRIIMFSSLNYCFKEILSSRCDGCVLDMGNQQGHMCLHWTKTYTNSLLRMVAKKLQMEKILYMMTIFATAVRCLSLRTEHLKNAVILQNTVAKAKDPEAALNRIIRPYDNKWVEYGQKVVKNRPYQFYLNVCTECENSHFPWSFLKESN